MSQRRIPEPIEDDAFEPGVPLAPEAPLARSWWGLLSVSAWMGGRLTPFVVTLGPLWFLPTRAEL